MKVAALVLFLSLPAHASTKQELYKRGCFDSGTALIKTLAKTEYDSDLEQRIKRMCDVFLKVELKIKPKDYK